MVSWGFAFKKGAIIFLWSIVWGIIGGVIFLIIGGAGWFGAIGAIIADPTDISPIMGAMGLMIAGGVIGGIISGIGMYATMVKIIVETVQELK
jgi:hypothetical protein